MCLVFQPLVSGRLAGNANRSGPVDIFIFFGYPIPMNKKQVISKIIFLFFIAVFVLEYLHPSTNGVRVFDERSAPVSSSSSRTSPEGISFSQWGPQAMIYGVSPVDDNDYFLSCVIPVLEVFGPDFLVREIFHPPIG